MNCAKFYDITILFNGDDCIYAKILRCEPPSKKGKFFKPIVSTCLFELDFQRHIFLLTFLEVF